LFRSPDETDYRRNKWHVISSHSRRLQKSWKWLPRKKKKKKTNFDLHHLRHCKRHSYLGPPPLLTDPNRFCSVRAAESIFIR
jgi:hypothetical protein